MQIKNTSPSGATILPPRWGWHLLLADGCYKYYRPAGAGIRCGLIVSTNIVAPLGLASVASGDF